MSAANSNSQFDRAQPMREWDASADRAPSTFDSWSLSPVSACKGSILGPAFQPCPSRPVAQQPDGQTRPPPPPVLGLLAVCALCWAWGAAAARSLPAASSPAAERAASPATGGSSSGGGACCQRLFGIGFHSNLPVVLLDSAGEGFLYHIDTPVEICTCNSGQGFADYEGVATAAVRGASSATFTKKLCGEAAER